MDISQHWLAIHLAGYRQDGYWVALEKNLRLLVLLDEPVNSTLDNEPRYCNGNPLPARDGMAQQQDGS